MVDPKIAAKLIRQHFAALTTEQFVKNLGRACPEVFEQSEETVKHPLTGKIPEKPELESKESEKPK